MSKFEPDTKINYEAMDDKLKARRRQCGLRGRRFMRLAAW
jgi:hypothetical protein